MIIPIIIQQFYIVCDSCGQLCESKADNRGTQYYAFSLPEWVPELMRDGKHYCYKCGLPPVRQLDPISPNQLQR